MEAVFVVADRDAAAVTEVVVVVSSAGYGPQRVTAGPVDRIVLDRCRDQKIKRAVGIVYRIVVHGYFACAAAFDMHTVGFPTNVPVNVVNYIVLNLQI